MNMTNAFAEQTPMPMAENVRPQMAEEQDSIFAGLPTELLDSLNAAKTRMILLYLTGQYTQKKIASIIGVSENTIRAWLIDPVVQQIIREIQAREFAIIEANLKALQYKAVSTMNELMDSCMDNVRFSAAKDVLDRGGHKPQQSIKVDKTVTTVEQQLASLVDFTIDDSEVIDIDIDDVVEEVKNG